MKIEKEESVDINRVRQILDTLCLYKSSTCLSSIKLVQIIHDKPLYDVEYVSKDSSVDGNEILTFMRKAGEKVVV